MIQSLLLRVCLIMTTTKNAENFCQEKSRISLIVEQILAFNLNTNLVRKVKNLSPNLKRNTQQSFSL